MELASPPKAGSSPTLPLFQSMQTQQIAAVDLGSNSFHMVVAEIRANELIILDRLREMVRLGEGLTADLDLTPEVQKRALVCLERFGQRLRGIPTANVRAVGTNTLRAARNAENWLDHANRLLGHPIEIISGIEEARLIYQGVATDLPADGARRLVIDIGGGSTEYIIGVDQTPLQKESLRMGCVSMSMRHFPEGKLTSKRFRKAVVMAEQELEPFQHLYRRDQWASAVGASGTLKATQKLLVHRGWSDKGITAAGLDRLIESMLAAGRLHREGFPELNPDRYPSFAGGVAVIKASFKALEIDRLIVAEGALREGLLQDLLGRINHEDVRDRTVQALAFRYHIEMEHARLIRNSALSMLDAIPLPRGLERERAEQWLSWAALLHDIGRDIAHSGHHKHGAYILENADLPGFSRSEQRILAILVRSHRRKFPSRLFRELPSPLDEAIQWLAVLLRLAVLIHRSRALVTTPQLSVSIRDNLIRLRFPQGWLENHPLTVADLEQEAVYLEPAGLGLIFEG